MKTLAAVVLLAALALPANAGVIHDESADGDLSSDPANPTPLAFSPGGNTIIGRLPNTGANPDPRDYITFTIPAGQILRSLILAAYSPLNTGFAAFNAGTTSFIPDFDTDPFFLAGIHVTTFLVGSDLMPLFVNNVVTTNALPLPELGPGDYCFLIQQVNAVTTSYTLEFVVDGGVPVQTTTWGTIKQLYR